MNELIIAVPLSVAIAFSIYVYFSLKRIVKQTTALSTTVALLLEKLQRLATLTYYDWSRESQEISKTIESHKEELLNRNPEIVSFSSILRYYNDSLGWAPEPVNEPETNIFYKTVGQHLEEYVSAMRRADRTRATDEMTKLQAFISAELLRKS